MHAGNRCKVCLDHFHTSFPTWGVILMGFHNQNEIKHRHTADFWNAAETKQQQNTKFCSIRIGPWKMDNNCSAFEVFPGSARTHYVNLFFCYSWIMRVTLSWAVISQYAMFQQIRTPTRFCWKPPICDLKTGIAL